LFSRGVPRATSEQPATRLKGRSGILDAKGEIMDKTKLSPIRQKACGLLEQVDHEIKSNERADQVKFETLTMGMTQKKLLAEWESTKHTKTLRTVCIDFVCWYAKEMKINIISSIPPSKVNVKADGFFSLKETLGKCGKRHAWVSAANGTQPQCGDILRHTAYHVDVALEFVAGSLVRVAGGQSSHVRPTNDVSKEFDNVMRVDRKVKYDPRKLQGWLDLDLYFGATPSLDLTLDWLHGWWKVWDTNYYYYFFGPGGVVQYIKSKPSNISRPPVRADNTGTYTHTANLLVIDWKQSPGAEFSCQEKFYNAAPGCRQMNATSNLYSPLVATRDLS